MKREQFSPLQAQQVAAAFARHHVDYMFIDKSGAILLGYPGTTQDVDVYPRKSEENHGALLRLYSILVLRSANTSGPRSSAEKILFRLRMVRSILICFSLQMGSKAMTKPRAGWTSPAVFPY